MQQELALASGQHKRSYLGPGKKLMILLVWHSALHSIVRTFAGRKLMYGWSSPYLRYQCMQSLLTSPKMRKESELDSRHSSSTYESRFFYTDVKEQRAINPSQLTTPKRLQWQQRWNSNDRVFQARQLLPIWLSIKGWWWCSMHLPSTMFLHLFLFFNNQRQLWCHQAPEHNHLFVL